MFGKSEANIIAEMQAQLNAGQLTVPETWDLETICDLYKTKACHKRDVKLYPAAICVVDGVDSRMLQGEKLGANSIVQLASQFNYLESPKADVVPVSQYPLDKTQGPLRAIEAAAVTLYRHASVTNKGENALKHALAKVLPHDALTKMVALCHIKQSLAKAY